VQGNNLSTCATIVLLGFCPSRHGLINFRRFFQPMGISLISIGQLYTPTITLVGCTDGNNLTPVG
jgi:hypothetical protein